jgi:hypothetical protein
MMSEKTAMAELNKMAGQEHDAEFSSREVGSMQLIRRMLFERMAAMSTPKAKNNANEAITVIEKMAKELGHPFY